MLIIGSYFFTWGSAFSPVAWQCGQCGAITPFRVLKGMRWLTIFFIIPILPLSGVKHMAECPGCRARYALQPPPMANGAAQPRSNKPLLIILGALILGSMLLCSVVALATALAGNTAASRNVSTGDNKPKYGPASGQLTHRDETMAVKRANVNLRDFIAEARFTNPYASDEHRWDYGFVFRSQFLGPEYRLAVLSDRSWALYLTTTSQDSDDWPIIAQGTIADLNIAAGGANTLRLEATNSTALFLVNGRTVSTLDLSARLGTGDVGVGTGFFQDDTVVGKTTTYDHFAVWAPTR